MEEQQELIDLSDYPKTKVCTICQKRLPIEKFGKRVPNKDGYDSWCIKCDREYRKKYQTRYYKENRRSELSRALVRYYGITMDDKERMLIEQDYKCSICGKELELFGRDTHVDHSHDTGEIRSILCNSCNSMIGHAKEDRNILLKAVEYLDRFT